MLKVILKSGGIYSAERVTFEFGGINHYAVLHKEGFHLTPIVLSDINFIIEGQPNSETETKPINPK